MTNSTKLTDIPGASEALPKKKYIDYPCDKDNVFLQAKREVIDEIESVHLEVDVEAMAEIIKNCDKTNVVKDGKWENYLSADEWVAKALSDTIPKWARLVRK